ncbi:cobalt-precorrin-6A reductase [Fodinicola feengrottensis]|uniref:Cobalt-precorrin-6A reductase n=1 Tax=Fodinicola feengrottensis TaxID=435914 RepID=A0ABN2I108_9ACTN|nr:cobalt-precorrin-6A reductase [Fodinicola feengrottensis]
MRARVLLLGGTGEARRLAAALEHHPRVEAISSLAGRVREPARPAGAVRIGGFGGVEGLLDWLRTNEIAAVIDATHPFASTMTRSAAAATERLALPYVVLQRPGWEPRDGDDWHWVDRVGDLPVPGERVFLTTGRTDAAAFAASDRWFLLRSVDPPEPPLPARLTVLLNRGPYPVDGELALLREHRIDLLVTKNSGGQQTAAKLTAARELGLPVVIVRRPKLPAVAIVETEAQAVAWLENVIPDSGGA